MNALTAIDRATVLGIGQYAPMLEFRASLRGGEGYGVDITEGPVPKMENGFYDVQDGRAPALFVSRCTLSPLPEEAIAYSVTVTMVLPRFVDGAKTDADTVQEAVDLILQAAQQTTTIDRTSIVDRLAGYGYSQCSVYTFEHLGLDGGELQPRASARLRFQVPHQALTGRTLGVR